MIDQGSIAAGLHISAARSVKYMEGRESPLACDLSSTNHPEQRMNVGSKVRTMVLAASVAAMGLFSGPAVRSDTTVIANAQSQLYLINAISRCDKRCPFYDPPSGCWCFQL